MTEPGHGGDAASSPAPRRQRRPEATPAQRALGLLTRREHSARELERKLGARGIEPAEARATVDRMREAGWQDDGRFAELLVRSRASAGHGPLRIRAELATHGLDRELVAAAVTGYEEAGAPDCWVVLARDLIRRRHPDALTGDRAAQRKAADFLLRRGFSMEQVRAVVHCD